MTFQNSSGSLAAAVPPGGSFDAPYPPGTAHGDFTGGREHAVVIGQNAYYSPNQITVAFSAANVTITNGTPSEWPVGAAYALSLDMPGSSEGYPSNDGKSMPRVQTWPVVYLNIGSPVEEKEEGLRVGAPIPAAGPVALLVNKFDVPRNITFHSTDPEDLIFTVTSTDEYGQKVYEEVDGDSHGRKAHYHNIVVVASGPSVGAVQIGWGPEIGLPCFVPSSAVILKELQDGVEVETPGVILFGDESAASATSGDVRGTYESEVTPDGNRSFGLLCCLPDPGYLGADQFTG